MTKSAMLRPKPHARHRKPYIPALPEWDICTHFAALVPAERNLLLHIIEKSDLVRVPGAPDHLLVQVTPRMLDLLAAFEAELEDLEPFMEDETEEDDDRDNDWELDKSDLEPDRADYDPARLTDNPIPAPPVIAAHGVPFHFVKGGQY